MALPELDRLDPLRRLALQLLSGIVLGAYKLARGDRLVLGRGVIANHRLVIKGPGTVVIGDRANLFAFGVGRRTRIVARKPGAVIRIGANARLNATELHADGSIEIGEDCILGGALVTDTDVHSTAPDRRWNPDAPIRALPVVIEANVWIARAAAVLPGVRVGRGSVVAYGAIVVSDVPSGTVVAGNPARVVSAVGE